MYIEVDPCACLSSAHVLARSSCRVRKMVAGYMGREDVSCRCGGKAPVTSQMVSRVIYTFFQENQFLAAELPLWT